MQHFIVAILLATCYFRITDSSKYSPFAVEVDQSYDEGCILDEKTERIQVAFVVDNTWTNKIYVERLKEASKVTMNRLNTLHPGTEFALTTHANWEQSAYNPPKNKRDAKRQKRGHEDPEGCFVVLIPFTSNVDQFYKEVADKLSFKWGPTAPDGAPEENGVSALAFCAADKKVGWERGVRDKKGKRIHRFMVMVTDEWSRFDLPNPGDRKPYRGDGSDTCQTTLPVPVSELGRALDQYDIYIIGAYFKKNNTYTSYVKAYKEYGFGYRHCHGQGAYFEPNNFGKDLSDLVYECVKKVLRCMYLDPPGYNTLGL